MKKLFKYIFHFDHLAVCLSTFAMLGLLSVVTFNLDILNPVADALDNFSPSDIFFDIEHSGSEPQQCEMITIVDMTELHQRGDIAMLFEEINMNDPLLVGVDLIFEGVKDDALGNELLTGAVQGMSDAAVFSRKLIDYNSDQDTFTGSVRSFFAEDLGVKEAYTNLNSNMQGKVIREMSIRQSNNEEELLSFPAQLAAKFDESLYERENENLIINYSNVSFPVVKWDEIAENSDLIEGHIVLVGTMTEEQDMHMTPLGKMAGLELQAYSLLTLLEHKNIQKTPWWITLLLGLILCYLLGLAIDSSEKLMDRYSNLGSITFLKESEIIVLILIFIFVVMACWIAFSTFINHSIIIEVDIILALLVLLFEGRKMYIGLIRALCKKHNWKFLRNSIYYEELK